MEPTERDADGEPGATPHDTSAGGPRDGHLARLAGLAPLAAIGAIVAAASAASSDVRTDTGPRVLAGPAETTLHTAAVAAGEDAVLEVCGASLRDGATRPASMRLALREAGREVLALDTPEAIDRRRRAGPEYGCVRLAEVTDHPRASQVTLSITGAVEPGVAPEPFVGRMVARAPLPLGARVGLGLAAALPLLGLLAMRGRPGRLGLDRDREGAPTDPAAPNASAARLVPTLTLAAVAFGLGLVPWPLPTNPPWLATALRGAPMALALALPVALAPSVLARPARETLSVHGARVRTLAGALALGVLVLVVGRLLDRLLPADRSSAVVALATPSLARAHVEAHLDPALGLVVFTGYALLAPVLEELFFRGLVFTTVERAAGARVAAAVAFLAFTAGHLPQTEGRLASLLSIALLSIASTTMRMRTGSVLPSVGLHLAHNGLVVLVTWLAR